MAAAAAAAADDDDDDDGDDDGVEDDDIDDDTASDDGDVKSGQQTSKSYIINRDKVVCITCSVKQGQLSELFCTTIRDFHNIFIDEVKVPKPLL